MNRVKVIINDWDPIGILKYAPGNTYDEEVGMIWDYLHDVNSTEDLAWKIHETFMDHYGSDIFNKKQEECMKIACKIMIGNKQ